MQLIYVFTKKLKQMWQVSMEYHQEQLLKHCRICGNRLNKAKGRSQPVYSCTEHSADLAELAGVPNASSEDCLVYPQSYCNTCSSKLKRAKQAAKDGFPFPSIVAMEWFPHEEGCKVGRILHLINC